MNPAPPPITPEQLREARALLGWSSDRLAVYSGTSPYTITKFEKSGDVVINRSQPAGFNALASIRAALEAAGVEFIEQGDGGSTVQLAGSND